MKARKIAGNNIIPMTIEELKAKPCRRGHSRLDAYVFRDPFSSRIVVNYKTCAIEYHRKKVK